MRRRVYRCCMIMGTVGSLVAAGADSLERAARSLPDDVAGHVRSLVDAQREWNRDLRAYAVRHRLWAAIEAVRAGDPVAKWRSADLNGDGSVDIVDVGVYARWWLGFHDFRFPQACDPRGQREVLYRSDHLLVERELPDAPRHALCYDLPRADLLRVAPRSADVNEDGEVDESDLALFVDQVKRYQGLSEGRVDDARFDLTGGGRFNLVDFLVFLSVGLGSASQGAGPDFLLAEFTGDRARGWDVYVRTRQFLFAFRLVAESGALKPTELYNGRGPAVLLWIPGLGLDAPWKPDGLAVQRVIVRTERFPDGTVVDLYGVRAWETVFWGHMACGGGSRKAPAPDCQSLGHVVPPLVRPVIADVIGVDPDSFVWDREETRVFHGEVQMGASPNFEKLGWVQEEVVYLWWSVRTGTGILSSGQLQHCPNSCNFAIWRRPCQTSPDT